MTKHLDLKMATVIEEDFDHEEYEERESFSDNYSNQGKKEGNQVTNLFTGNHSNEALDDSSDADSDSRSSIIEKDNENIGLPAVIINSVQRNEALPQSQKEVDSSSNLKLEIPSEARDTPSPTTSPEQTRLRRFARSMTLSMKDKYVTELCFLHPDSTSRNKMISLGVFLSTSLRFGDHTIYKISPISPLKVLPLQPQDRIMKINKMPISFWSHNSIVNFVRCLSHSSQSEEASTKTSTEIKFSMEYIPYSKTSSSGDQGPSREEVTLSVIISTNGRMVLGCFSSSSLQLWHLGVIGQKSIKLYGEIPVRYISIQTHVANSENDNSDDTHRLIVTTGKRLLTGNNTRFTFHEFDMTYSTGQVFAIETYRAGHYLYSASNEPGSRLSVMASMEGSDLSNLSNSSDSRLFRITSDGGNKAKIQNINSELYIKVENQTVSLEPAPARGVFPNSMYFEIFPPLQ